MTFIGSSPPAGGGGVVVCNSLPSVMVAGQAGSAGVDADAARCDHVHAVPVASPDDLVAGGAAVGGVSGAFSRADHVHAAPTAAPASLGVGDAPATGAAATFVHADHQHGVPAAAPVDLAAGNASAPGAAATFVRSDHQHGVPVAAPVSVTGGTNGVGVSASLVRADHQHALELAVQDEGIAQGVVHTLNFTGAGVSAAVAAGIGTVNIPGGGGGGGSFVQATVVGGASISSASFVTIGGMSIVIPADGDYDVNFNAEVQVIVLNTYDLRLTLNGVEITGTRRLLGDLVGEAWPVSVEKFLPGLSMGDTIEAQVARQSGIGSVTVRDRIIKAIEQ